jgi:serine/threonine-protein kinase
MSDVVARLNAALEGRYAIERQLGEGGMATVYLADDLKHERKVALKVLKPELAAVVGAERFLAEIKTTANLQHPHILPLFDSGEADSFLFYVMPYVEGETLQGRIDREKQLPVDEAVRIATAVANALDHAHRNEVIHRDIKPANILLQDGEPMVADFGMALAVGAAGGHRLTETGLSMGTPFYMSPEQATGDQIVGDQSDVYALACVLYEMLVGEPPYTGTTAQAVLGKIIQGAPVSATSIRGSIPANVDAAMVRALEKLPADRFTGAQDFAKALADPGFRHGELVEAGVAAGVGPWKRLTIAGWSAAAVFALGLGWALLAPRAAEARRALRVALPGRSGAGGPSPPSRSTCYPTARWWSIGDRARPGGRLSCGCAGGTIWTPHPCAERSALAPLRSHPTDGSSLSRRAPRSRYSPSREVPSAP